MNFNDVAGQRVIVESLKNAVKNGMISNGYVFSGPKGCGKKLMAFIFAMALNCSGATVDKPCGSCSSCQRTESGNHPNVEIVKPTGQSIKIKQIRQIISDAARKPFETGYKIIIIENAEKMTHEAQDAFLKTLEEPPEDTVFILLAENHNILLPTIISRCQVYQFKPVDMKIMKDFLTAKHVFSAEAIDAAVRQSKGVIGKALEFLDNKESLKSQGVFAEILDKALTGNRSDALMLAVSVIDDKGAAESFLEFATAWFRDLMLLKEGSESVKSLIINIDSIDLLMKYNSVLTEVQLNSIMEIIKDTAKYVRYNVSIKNSIDGMLLNIAEVSLYNG
jgi:DNA polymerase-3 subunit delta'